MISKPITPIQYNYDGVLIDEHGLTVQAGQSATSTGKDILIWAGRGISTSQDGGKARVVGGQTDGANGDGGL